MSVETIDVGVPSAECMLSHEPRKWEKSCLVRFHDFENLDTTAGAFVDSPTFMAFGHQWKLKLFPGGEWRRNRLVSDEGMVALYLCHCSQDRIKIQYALNTVTESGTRKHNHGGKRWKEFKAERWGRVNFAKRPDLIKDLVGGSLIIEVRLGADNSGASDKPFTLENPLTKSILSKFADEKTSDVTFEVSGSGVSEAGSPKRTKTSTTFHAHKFILQDWVLALEELSKAEGDATTPITISDVRPDIFHHLLYYSYGGKIDGDDLEAHAKDIIDAADKYGIVGLKLEAEASFVSSISIAIDNVMDHLLYADGKNCALLKEAAMDFLVENAGEGIKKLSFDNVPGHMMKDLMTVFARREESRDAAATADPTDLSTARVSKLRKILFEKGLDVDGSREIMIARLEQHSAIEDTSTYNYEE